MNARVTFKTALLTSGYNDECTEIRVGGRKGETAEVWIEQHGLKDVDSPHRASETLAYADLSEIIALRDECNQAIRVMTGLNEN